MIVTSIVLAVIGYFILMFVCTNLVGFVVRGLVGEGEDNTLTDLHLYPNYATQTLTFKRVSATNQRRVEIVSPEDLAITRGIEAPAPLETFNA